MHLPDNESDYRDDQEHLDEDHPDQGHPDEDALDGMGDEALVWQLLLLVNPGDEETALRQFTAYRDAVEQAPDAVPAVWRVKDAIDWRSGFHVDAGDSATFIDAVNELASRWSIDLDWGGDPSDEDFLEAVDIPTLMATAYDRLREHGYTLWTWSTDSEAHAGWIGASRDDEAMRRVASALEIELRAGSDPF
jgi:hypothetical protein